MPSLGFQIPFQYMSDSSKNPYTIYLNESIKYQQIDGFGASITDSSAWLLNYKLSDAKRAQVMESLFGKTGISISLLRQPMGSTAFAWDSWTFDDMYGLQDNLNTTNFSLCRESVYIRPMLNLDLKFRN